MGVKILTDSTSYIAKDLVESLDIGILSLIISFPDESLKETETDNNKFYKMMEEKGIPVSSQPSLGEVYQAMTDIVSRGDEIVCIFLSSEMSGTFNSAYKVSEVVIVAEENIKRSRFLFIPETLEYLKKGGRIGGAAALFGMILKIVPVLTVKDGQTSVFAKVRTRVKAIQTMISKLLKDNIEYKVKEIIVHHINCYDQASELADRIKDKLNMEVSIVDIGPIIGMHVGPGAIGIAYYTEKEILS